MVPRKYTHASYTAVHTSIEEVCTIYIYIYGECIQYTCLVECVCVCANVRGGSPPYHMGEGA